MKYGEAQKKIIIFSGAGISQPSGISTFRDSNGLWENHKIEEICNENAWKNNFEAVHKFYNQRRTQLAEVQPNIAHKTVAKIIEKYGEENVINVTQNVDDLFERAGVEALHLHGDLTRLKCEACGHNWSVGHQAFNIETDRCSKCNSLKAVRPDIVFFYGHAPNYIEMYKAFDYTMHKNSIVIVIGTMGNVVNISQMLWSTPCKKILCNMEESEYIKTDNFDAVYYESVETAIHKIVQNIEDWWDN